MRESRTCAILCCLALAGCAHLPKGGGGQSSGAPSAPEPAATELTEAPPPPPSAVTVEQFDTTTDEERKAAVAAPSEPDEKRLGTTIATLGNAADPGFWAETPLVSEIVIGRLEYPATGKSVQVELRPSGGAPGSGTRVSLPALRLLDAPLAGLPELVVIGP